MYSRTITAEMISDFSRQLIKEERSEATVRKYIHDIKVFEVFVGARTLDKEVTVLFKKKLMETYAPSSTNSMIAAVNRFLKGIGRYDCTVKPLRIQRQAFRPKEKELTKAEYLRLLEGAKKHKDIRLLLLMQTICATGIRVSELKFITVEAVKAGNAVVSLKGKTRRVLIPTALRKELRQYIRAKNIYRGSIFVTRTGNPMDRSNILHAMKNLCTEAGVNPEKVFPHNLRHLFACLFYKASKDISHLADILGHSNINTTRIYTCVSGVEQQRQIGKLGLLL